LHIFWWWSSSIEAAFQQCCKDFFDGYFQCMSIEFLVLMNVSAMKMLLIVVAVGGKRQLTA
jgi:hypothetical protein